QGADISDIELIIQFGVPSSLSVWIQRAGRGGRDPSLQARAILLYEKSMFMRKKKRKRKGNTAATTVTAPPGPDASDSESAPTGDCCDNCVRIAMQVTAPLFPPAAQGRPATPEQNAEPSSAHSTPSKDKNANGKRPMARGSPKTRRAEHRQTARDALERWRLRTYLEKYSKSSLPEVGIMSDQIVTTLALKRLKTVEEMLELRPSWILARRHGDEVLAVLQRVDERVEAEKQRTNEVASAARKELTAARKAAVAATKPPKLPRGRVARRLALATMSANVSVSSIILWLTCLYFLS
ncbi:hypothetical protein GGX14DRAFT_375854, partial [Mycena pura]